jgi:hypothetical protein
MKLGQYSQTTRVPTERGTARHVSEVPNVYLREENFIFFMKGSLAWS